MRLPTKRLSEPRHFLMLGVVYTLLITFAFLLPGNTVAVKTTLPIDKLVHVVLHAILLYVWLSYGTIKRVESSLWVTVIIIFLSCISYGIIIELLQSWVTVSRKADVGDVLANFAGSILGWILFVKLK